MPRELPLSMPPATSHQHQDQATDVAAAIDIDNDKDIDIAQFEAENRRLKEKMALQEESLQQLFRNAARRIRSEKNEEMDAVLQAITASSSQQQEVCFTGSGSPTIGLWISYRDSTRP